MTIKNNISKTAFYTCGCRFYDSLSKNEVSGDINSRIFINRDALEIFMDFKELTMSNLSICGRHKIITEYIKNISMNKKIQVLNIGCGFDTRGFSVISNNILAWYDVDTEELINYRKKILIDNNIDCTNNIAVDFFENYLDELLKIIDSSILTIFIFEGVFPYLCKKDISSIINSISSRTSNFNLIFDVLNQKFYKKRAIHLEEKVKKLGASFEYIPKNIDAIADDNKLKIINRWRVVHQSIKYKFPKIPMFLLYIFFPKNLLGYQVQVIGNE